MPLHLPNAIRSLRRISPAWLAWLLTLGLMVWMGLRIQSFLTDQDIPTSLIQAQQIRVKTGQVQEFFKVVATYQQPAPAEAVPAERFGPTPTPETP